MLIDTVQQLINRYKINKFIPWNTCDLKKAYRKK